MKINIKNSLQAAAHWELRSFLMGAQVGPLQRVLLCLAGLKQKRSGGAAVFRIAVYRGDKVQVQTMFFPYESGLDTFE